MILHQDLPPNPLKALSDYSGSCSYPTFDKLGSLSLPTYDGAVCLTAETIGLDWKRNCSSFDICLFLAVPGLRCFTQRNSLVATSEGYSLAVRLGLLIAVVPLVTQRGPQLHGFSSWGVWA